MSFKSISRPKKYFKYSECDVDQVLVTGKYLGRSPNQFGKENFDFENSDGVITCLNHAGHLAWGMSSIQEGELVQVVYKGKITLDKGTMAGKEAHQFDILVDREETPTYGGSKDKAAAPGVKAPMDDEKPPKLPDNKIDDLEDLE